MSLLPVCGKIFERLIYNILFDFFIAHELISSNQPGFKLGGSCINQLLSITHETYKSFDGGYEIRGVFFDISKAFDGGYEIRGVFFDISKAFDDGYKIRGVFFDISKAFDDGYEIRGVFF